MNRYLQGQDVAVVLPLVDDVGLPIQATAGSYRVLDQDGAVVVNTTAAPNPTGLEELSIAVPAVSNTLVAPAVQALRVLELTLTTATGTKLLTAHYLIEALEPLVVPDNSFQTLSQAEFRGASMPRLTAWEGAGRADRIAALIQARLNIAQLRFRQYFYDDQTHDIVPWTYPADITQLTASEFNSLDPVFVDHLRRAQVFEADEILIPVTDARKKRENGLMSESVGEVSQMFRPGKPVKGLVGERTMSCLAKYVIRRVRITRT